MHSFLDPVSAITIYILLIIRSLRLCRLSTSYGSLLYKISKYYYVCFIKLMNAINKYSGKSMFASKIDHMPITQYFLPKPSCLSLPMLKKPSTLPSRVKVDYNALTSDYKLCHVWERCLSGRYFATVVFCIVFLWVLTWERVLT